MGEPLTPEPSYGECDCIVGHRCDCWDYREPGDPKIRDRIFDDGYRTGLAARLSERVMPQTPVHWWQVGSMVIGGPGDEHFIGAAATPEDAERIVAAHNCYDDGYRVGLAADDPNDGDDRSLWTDDYAAEYARSVAADRGEVWTDEQVAEYIGEIRAGARSLISGTKEPTDG